MTKDFVSGSEKKTAKGLNELGVSSVVVAKECLIADICNSISVILVLISSEKLT